ncbi:hypothetical protein MUB04_15050 [Acinetobacter indicus]|uniref:hypothetical protein n=1 Tax=Acinetobacter TaxID=469 RepID=UPI0015D26B76|nr:MULTISPECIES: hypothetical protein [Acinetobacter]MCP0917852.1 hypothetical protein [Acinetobacter indicus]
MTEENSNIVSFSRAKASSDEAKVDNLLKAVKGFGFQTFESPEPLSFNVVTGNSPKTGAHVVRVELKENGWFFKADLASLDYGSKNTTINRTDAHTLINEAMGKLQSEFTGVKINGIEYSGVWQIRDFAHEENFTILFMLGVSRKENTSPISVIQHLANVPKIGFKLVKDKV